MKVVYGLKSAGADDKYIAIADAAIRMQSAANVPGAYLVDSIPARAFLSARPTPTSPAPADILR